MRTKLTIDEFITLGNEIKGLEKRTSELINESGKKLPKRVTRHLITILKTIMKFRMEARYEMLKKHAGSPRCRKAGLDAFGF
jgi:hypothetical protein